MSTKMLTAHHPDAPCDLKVGDVVTYTNEYGVVFPNRKVTGFCKPESYGSVYSDGDAYWFPVHPDQLQKQPQRKETTK